MSIKQPRPKIEDKMALELKAKIGRMPKKEFKFHPTRRWRFDLAYPDILVAIEIDGSRHASLKRNRQDAEKRNAAIEAGWVVLTYPANLVLNQKRLQRILEQVYRVVCDVNSPDDSGCALTGD